MGVMDNLLQTESARVVSLINDSHSDGISGKLSMENVDCASLGSLPKYKRRKISAVRDFPPGCGRFASRISLIPNGEIVVGTVQTEAENVVVSSNHVDMPDLIGADPKGMLLSDAENVNTLGGSISDVSKNLNTVNIGILDEEMVLQSGLQAPSSPTSPNAIPKFSNLEKNLIRNYPPRRRVSAVRDFPPLCGRHAPVLSKEECMEALPSSGSSGQGNSGSEDKPLTETMETVNQIGENGYDGDAYMSEFGGDVSRITSGKVLAEFERHAAVEMKNHDDFGTSMNMMTVGQEDTREKSILRLHETKRYQLDGKSGVVIKSNKTPGRDIVVDEEQEQLDRTWSDFSFSNNQFQEDDSEGLQLALNVVIVQGLMASLNCPWRQEEGACKPNPVNDTVLSKKRNRNLLSASNSASKIMNKAKSSGGSYSKRKSSPRRNACENRDALVIRDEELGHNRECENFHPGQRSRDFDVTLPPSNPSSSSGKGLDNDATGTRNKVRETLRLFHAVCRKLLHGEEAKPSGQNSHKRVDYQAARILKEKGKYVTGGKKVIGSVTGVEVGDEFQYRVELNMIGLHLQIQGGIDYVKHNRKILATSIVASGGYDDNLDNSDVLIYTGQGGNVMNGGKEPEDQKLERGNLALVNSLHEQNPVRVIRGETKASDSRTYIYDGLYLVERYWQDVGPHGKLVFKFKLSRIPGQPELSWKVVKKCKKSKVREGLCVHDISQGKELIPICAVNTIDDEKPPPFKYITNIIYPDWCHPIPPNGCDCSNGCSELRKCVCVAKNGGEIPYNHNGAIVEAKPLVYECGPACNCPPSCYNRVSQHGIKFQLEIFKTETRGWGVRSLNSIPSGSFICEYVGELIEEKEAEKRGNDEYLFDIGNNYKDSSLWAELSTVMPDPLSSSCGVVEDGGFTIDAAEYGSVGRFVNHSCSPNLYAQNVLYDHEDRRMPHIMLFAAENIPPLQELTYHYNYVLDQVHDSAGNIKKKSCYCGSSECTGRLY